MVKLGSQPKSTNKQDEFDNQRDEVYGSLRSTVGISCSYVGVPEGNRWCKPAMTHTTAIYSYSGRLDSQEFPFFLRNPVFLSFFPF